MKSGCSVHTPLSSTKVALTAHTLATSRTHIDMHKHQRQTINASAFTRQQPANNNSLKHYSSTEHMTHTHTHTKAQVWKQRRWFASSTTSSQSRRRVVTSSPIEVRSSKFEVRSSKFEVRMFVRRCSLSVRPTADRPSTRQTHHH